MVRLSRSATARPSRFSPTCRPAPGRAAGTRRLDPSAADLRWRRSPSRWSFRRLVCAASTGVASAGSPQRAHALWQALDRAARGCRAELGPSRLHPQPFRLGARGLAAPSGRSTPGCADRSVGLRRCLALPGCPRHGSACPEQDSRSLRRVAVGQGLRSRLVRDRLRDLGPARNQDSGALCAARRPRQTAVPAAYSALP